MIGSQFFQTDRLFVVDDDVAMREALLLIFTRGGYRVGVFADAETFLAAARNRPPAGVLLDLHLPDKSGLATLKDLNAQHYPAPVFMISGEDDVASAVDAMKSGAVDYLLKPLDVRTVVARVRNCIAEFAKRDTHTQAVNGMPFEFGGQVLLTPRECEVLAQITAGTSNKEAGRCLGISPRTVEVHRARIMEKFGARNAADLVRIVLSGSKPLKIVGPAQLRPQEWHSRENSVCGTHRLAGLDLP